MVRLGSRFGFVVEISSARLIWLRYTRNQIAEKVKVADEVRAVVIRVEMIGVAARETVIVAQGGITDNISAAC